MADAAPKHEGPCVAVVVTTSCSGCTHLSTEHWSIEDGNDYDWGIYHYCALLHPGEKKDIGDFTPKECPFLQDATVAALAKAVP
jgi:hypothetical protein